MPHAEAIIGTTNYEVAITAGHHELKADERFPWAARTLVRRLMNCSVQRCAPAQRSLCECMQSARNGP